MSFADLKGGQIACAKTFDRSIAVVAGAGSGKTFTLRERVAKAFDADQEDGQQGPIVDNIGQVMAITFTEKAAAELRSRIKAALREIGRADQAVLVDEAWIGTIHGVCSRILRENAFDLGVDPRFQIVPDDEWEGMRREAIDAALSGGAVSYEAVQALLVEYKPRAVVKSIQDLMALAAKSPDGPDAIVAPSAPELRHLQQSLEDELGIHSRIALPPLPNLNAGAFPEMMQWRDAVRGLLDEAFFRGPDALAAPGAKPPAISTQLQLDLELALAWPFQSVLSGLAADALRRFDEMKRMRGQLDQDDLLLKACAALSRPEVAARYADRFKMVMVDEFQDTDPVQLAIIRHLTGPDDCRLCVVGDPQQSIYRFRGADVSTYNRHVDALPKRSKIALDDNYRSHADILAFSDVVFTDEAGRPLGAYQRLNARRDESRARYDEGVEGPRVSVLDVRYPYRGGAEAIRREAEAIARRFEQIHKAGGRSYGDMAVLLGVMTNVDVFAAALQRRNIPYVVAKGSVLSKMPEAQDVVQLARAIANREDSEAVFNVEESAFFGLAPADFTQMRDRDGEPSARVRQARRVLARARARIGRDPLSKLLVDVLYESGWVTRLEDGAKRDPARRAANHAKLANALKVVRMAEAIEEERCCDAALVASIMVQRMSALDEPPGALSAKDSNFVRLMTIHASKGLQFPIVAVAEFGGSGAGSGSSRIVSEGMADARGKVWQCAVLDPGVSADDYETTRKFECRSTEKMLELLACEQEPISDERARRCIWPDEGDGAWGADGADGADATGAAGGVGGAGGADSADVAGGASSAEDLESAYALDAARFRAGLVAHARAADDAELERKLYVAFTRAEEALLVCMRAQVKASGEAAVPKGVQERIVAAESRIAERWEYRYEVVGADGEDGEGDGADAARGGEGTGESMDGECDFIVLDQLPQRPRSNWPYASMRNADVFSASSLARLEEDDEVPDFFDAACDEAGPEEKGDSGAGGGGHALVPAPDDAPDAQTAPGGAAGETDDGVAGAPGGAAGEAGGAAGALDAQARAAANLRGEAFHACARFAAMHRGEDGAIPALPARRLASIARSHGLREGADTEELRRRMDTWTSSDMAREMARFPHLRCEEPFFIRLGDDDEAPYLRGFIDLLAYDEPGHGTARVVDYKTGYRDMDDDARAAHFATQAESYACALLAQGFSHVELSFVFLDDTGPGGQPHAIRFGPFTDEAHDDTARDADGAPCTRAWLYADLREKARV